MGLLGVFTAVPSEELQMGVSGGVIGHDSPYTACRKKVDKYHCY